MTGMMERPDVGRELSHLKDFQRRTVDYVFQRMYLDEDPASRFLVADEVGLGKTLVARGVIVRAVYHMWDDTKRIDVVYVCANMDIARQNRSRLSFGGSIPELPDRITLLPVTVKNLGTHKFSFMAITPRTSLDPRSSGGRADERVLLYHLLQPARAWDFGTRVGPRRALKGEVGWPRWIKLLEEFQPATIDRSLWGQYLEALRLHDAALAEAGIPTLRERFDRLARTLAHRGDRLKYSMRTERDQLVGTLREVLARTCLRALDPDLIVLDEFQRFRDLLNQDDDSPLNRLAHDLFTFTDADGSKVRVLLLSATPYKPYTGYSDTEDDHYRDFLQTVAFLQHDATATEDLRGHLQRYREALLQLVPAVEAGDGNTVAPPTHGATPGVVLTGPLDELGRAKRAVETALSRVMVRTERTRVGHSGDAMLRENSDARIRLDPADLHAWLAVTRLSAHVGLGPPVDYWKSAPYLGSLLDRERYDLKRKLTGPSLASLPAEFSRDLVGDGSGVFLDPAAIERYETLSPANARMRALLAETVDRGAWRLLWLPAALPYYEADPSSPYADASLSAFTKSLVFSCWNVVPKAIATLVSFEAERRMVAELAGEHRYSTLLRDRRPLLRFTESADRLTGMPVMLLLYPSAALARLVDPLAIRREITEDGRMPSSDHVVRAAEAGLRSAIEPIQARSGGGTADEAWYWSTIAQLDGLRMGDSTLAWLESNVDALRWNAMVQVRADSDDSNFDKHLDLFYEHVKAGAAGKIPDQLGHAPPDVARLLAQVALASPAVCALRSLQRLWPDTDILAMPEARAAAARIAMGFRSLFNLPESISLLRGSENERSRPYWRHVLDYCLAGNLQAVLDEYLHVLREYLGLIDVPVEDAVNEIGKAAADAVSLRTVRLTYDTLVHTVDGRKLDTASVRARFAMRFGDDAADTGDGSTRADQVRLAFNSPFRPFILATTSIGQEGLDFHLYCHRVVHWNLPSNPVDLEQREGRVHRYKGHAIRRNIAAEHADALFTPSRRVGAAIDPWGLLFDAAGRREGRDSATELDPYWIYERLDGAYIERHVLLLPLSREVQQLDRLKQELAIYRLAFGQPRQQDLLAALVNHLDTATLRWVLAECIINLEPK